MSALRIAWRNLLRNRRRTAITAVAVALNTAILIGSLALMEGMRQQMIRSATRLLVGDAQVHASGYLSDRSMYSAIARPDAILRAARSAAIAAAPRSYGFGLASQGTKSAGATFVGVDPDAERKAFELASELQTGSFLSSTPGRQAVIGNRLAKSLNAKIGSELIAVVQGADGSLGNELFTVIGIFKTVGEAIDRTAVFVHARDFEELFVSGGRIHEIALNAMGMAPTDVVRRLQQVAPDAEIKTWQQIMPTVSDMVNMMGAAVLIFAVVFFLGAGLGVLNTMLMATHDRVREFGVLKALGATPWRIIRDVATESYVLALVSTALGSVLGLALGLYLQTVGIDLTAFGDASFSFAGMAWDPLWRGHMRLEDIVWSVVAMWGACVLAALYPAIRVARLDPARAMTQV